jgi:PII-like signaling protein
MKLTGQGLLLRVFIGEADRWHGRPLYEALVLKAREAGLAGATVLRGLEGFGAHSRLHTAKVLRLSQDLPIVIELVDREDRIRAFIPVCDEMIGEGLITLEKVEVLKYQAGAPPAGGTEPGPPK